MAVTESHLHEFWGGEGGDEGAGVAVHEYEHEAPPGGVEDA